MKRNLRILFASFEAVPFIKTGGLGDVAGSLPQAIQAAGCEIRVILPKLKTIPEIYKNKMSRLTDFRVKLGWRDLYCGVETLTMDGVHYYFLDNEFYFKRDNIYGYFDDGERIAFFAKAVVEAIGHLPDFACDVLHCNDWHTAMAPVFLNEFYRRQPGYEKIRTVLTVHNLKFQGQYSDYVLGDILGLAGIPAAVSQLGCGHGSVNYMKGGLSYADAITTVSPTYAEEIKSPYFGEGLDSLFRRRANVLYGILNGIDTAEYDPAIDPLIPSHFKAGDLAGKAGCKAALQRELGLTVQPDVPLAIMISRLTDQKGLNLFEPVLDEILYNGIQVAVLGTGDTVYENLMRSFAAGNQGKMSASIAFDNALSHRMYAGADMILMPSVFEPCGLSQLIAMRYGTLPIVRETGGLRDTVQPYNQYTGEGTGFSFANINAHDMMFTLLRAASLYREQPDCWAGLVANAMAADFGWHTAARRYIEIYSSLTELGS